MRLFSAYFHLSTTHLVSLYIFLAHPLKIVVDNGESPIASNLVPRTHTHNNVLVHSRVSVKSVAVVAIPGEIEIPPCIIEVFPCVVYISPCSIYISACIIHVSPLVNTNWQLSSQFVH